MEKHIRAGRKSHIELVEIVLEEGAAGHVEGEGSAVTAAQSHVQSAVVPQIDALPSPWDLPLDRAEAALDLDLIDDGRRSAHLAMEVEPLR